MLIINPRGNNGSGKSTLTREFMKKLNDLQPVFAGKKIAYYVGRLGSSSEAAFKEVKRVSSWRVLGSYETQCGGCDGISPMTKIIDMVETARRSGDNVWLEGILLSDNYGAVGAYSERYANRWVFAYLNTPVDVCLKRILARRKKAGNAKPFDPERTLFPRQFAIERSRGKVLSLGRRVVDLNYRDPLPELLKIARKEG